MKRIVLIASLCMFAGFSMAQKKAVKQAKSAMSNTAEARGLIKPALTDAESAEDPETWKIAGDIEYAAFDKEHDAEMTKDMTNKGGNLEVMYDGLYNMVGYYKKADELGELPDAKGKIKNKFRKDIVKNFKHAYRLYINAGSHYNDKAIAANQVQNKEEAQKNFTKAADFFEIYWDMPGYEMFQGEEIVPMDSSFQAMKYYATVCAVQSNNPERSVQMLKKLIASPYIANNVHKESDAYELLAVEYQTQGDSTNYVKSLLEGADKFPKNQFFTPNLINAYIRAGDGDAALAHLDQAVNNDPEGACELLSVKGSLLAEEGTKYRDFTKSEEAYKQAIASNASCEKALEGLGILYVLQAQNAKEEIVHTTNKQKLAEIDKITIDFYLLALPLLEKQNELIKARADAEKFDINRSLHNLENVYYNLSLLNIDKHAELERVQKELGTAQ